MNVPDFAAEFTVIPDVAIKPATLLPEPRAAVAVGDPVQDRRSPRHPPRDHPLGDRHLEAMQRGPEGDCLRGPDEHVDVLGHDHPGEQLETELPACTDHGIDEEARDHRVREKGQASLAGARDEPDAARDLPPLHELADRCSLVHRGSVQMPAKAHRCLKADIGGTAGTAGASRVPRPTPVPPAGEDGSDEDPRDRGIGSRPPSTSRRFMRL